MEKNYEEILESSAFKNLVSKRWKISLLLTIIMLVSYFGYLLTIAFNKEILGKTIGKNLTLGIPVGLGLILLAWIMTGIYVYWANNHYDNIVTEIKNKIK
jgi:uncharacterized membrane protein (DUF485 family)